MKKRVSKVSKRRLVIFGTISIFLIIYAFSSLIYYNYKVYSLKQEKKNLNTQMTELKSSESDYKNTITKLQDKEYLARYARENYLYTKDNELVLDVRKDTNDVVEVETEKTDYNFIIIGLFIIVVIVGCVIKKKSKK